MTLGHPDMLLEVWAFDRDGKKVHPYKGVQGTKRGLYSVNFTNDTKKFQGMSEQQLIAAIEGGRFRDRGTIRMLPLNYHPSSERNAFAPLFYRARAVKSY